METVFADIPQISTMMIYSNIYKNYVLETSKVLEITVWYKNLTTLKQYYSEQITGKPFHEERLLLDFHLLLENPMLLDSLVLTEVLAECLSLPLKDLPKSIQITETIYKINTHQCLISRLQLNLRKMIRSK